MQLPTTTSHVILQPAPAEFRAAGAMLSASAALLERIRHTQYPNTSYSGEGVVAPMLSQALEQSRYAVNMLSRSTLDGAAQFAGAIDVSVVDPIERAQELYSASAQPYEVLLAVHGAISGARTFADALQARATVLTADDA